MFSSSGLPKEILSDNGPLITSHEFEICFRENEVKHTLSLPYDPTTHGKAERLEQVLKKGFEVLEVAYLRQNHRLANFLWKYRTTPDLFVKRHPKQE